MMNKKIYIFLLVMAVNNLYSQEVCIQLWNIDLSSSEIIADDNDNLYMYGYISEPEYTNNVIWGVDTFLYEENTYMITRINSDETFGWSKTFSFSGVGSSMRYADGTIYILMNSKSDFTYDGVTIKGSPDLLSTTILGINASDGSYKFSSYISEINTSFSSYSLRKILVNENGDLIVPMDFDFGFKTREDSVSFSKENDTTNATAILKFNSSGIHINTWIGYYDDCIADVYGNTVVVLGCKNPPLKDRIYEMSVLDKEFNTVSKISVPITISGLINQIGFLSYAFSNTTFRADANSVYLVSYSELDKELDVNYSTTIFGEDVKAQEDKYAFLSWDYDGNLKWMKFLDNTVSPEIDLNQQYLHLFGGFGEGKIIQDSVIIPNTEYGGEKVLRYDTASGNILQIFSAHSSPAYFRQFAQLSDGGYVLKSEERNRYLNKFLNAAPDRGDLFLYNYKSIVNLSKSTSDFKVSPIFYWCDNSNATKVSKDDPIDPYKIIQTNTSLEVYIKENLLDNQIILLDQLGRQVLNIKKKSNHFSIDIAQLPKGLYVILLDTSEGNYTKKILR